MSMTVHSALESTPGQTPQHVVGFHHHERRETVADIKLMVHEKARRHDAQCVCLVRPLGKQRRADLSIQILRPWKLRIQLSIPHAFAVPRRGVFGEYFPNIEV
jgi:hypothetical protein